MQLEEGIDDEHEQNQLDRSAGIARHRDGDGRAGCRAQQKPNVLVIMADDIGYWNISAYNRGMMGYRTPNIDRIANEGAIFTVLLRSAILHGWPRRVRHRPKPDAHRPAEGWFAGS